MKASLRVVPSGGERATSGVFGVVDLFSGAGGMSCGFHRHPHFKLLAAADAEIGKPSMGKGALQCNSTYRLNMGFAPVALDLADVAPDALREALGIGTRRVNVLSVCPPCTGFSRANPMNHLRDDPRNSLVGLAADFAVALDADIVVMENARELLSGNFRSHYLAFASRLSSAGYAVSAATHMLTRLGLPQIRERALIIAVKRPLPLLTLDDLWRGWTIGKAATTVRKALGSIPSNATHRDAYPRFADGTVAARLAAIPRDGGSWTDLMGHPGAGELLTPAMKRRIAAGKLGSHPDVYGRMWWDRPAPTIKRECAHIGNGRYAHPTENGLCSVREMATLQGFPYDFDFNGGSVSNHYRHIGDAVPPLVSHQIAWVCHWILTNRPPRPSQWVLDHTHMNTNDLCRDESSLMSLWRSPRNYSQVFWTPRSPPTPPRGLPLAFPWGNPRMTSR